MNVATIEIHDYESPPDAPISSERPRRRSEQRPTPACATPSAFWT